jgi:hypothetical protein
VVFRFFLVDEPTTGDLTYFSHRHAQQHQLQLNQLEKTSIQALAPGRARRGPRAN